MKAAIVVSALMLGACDYDPHPEYTAKRERDYERDRLEAIANAKSCRLANSLEQCLAACDSAYTNMTSAFGLAPACKSAAMAAPASTHTTKPAGE